MPHPSEFAARIRTPRAAALAGIVFAVLLITVIITLRSGVSDLGQNPGSWVASEGGRGSVTVAVNLIPFAGIAFLWFIGVIRTSFGDREDKLFATVFLGSGLLFVAMLFTTAAAVGSLLALTADGGQIDGDSQELLGFLAAQLLGAFGARMAAVFTLAVTTLGRRTGLIPRWLAVVGYVVPMLLFLTPPLTQWVQLLFPAWVLLLSVHILFTADAGDGDVVESRGAPTGP